MYLVSLHDSVVEENGGKLVFQNLGPDPDIPLLAELRFEVYTTSSGLYFNWDLHCICLENWDFCSIFSWLYLTAVYLESTYVALKLS